MRKMYLISCFMSCITFPCRSCGTPDDVALMCNKYDADWLKYCAVHQLWKELHWWHCSCLYVPIGRHMYLSQVHNSMESTDWYKRWYTVRMFGIDCFATNSSTSYRLSMWIIMVAVCIKYADLCHPLRTIHSRIVLSGALRTALSIPEALGSKIAVPYRKCTVCYNYSCIHLAVQRAIHY